MKDLTSLRFGRLTVIRYSESRGGRRFWECKCDCGNTCIVSTAHLTTGETTSCGCSRKGINAIDITGNRYGRLVAVSPTNERMAHSIKWLCHCDCGNDCTVAAIHLRNGDTTSCGCRQSEVHRKTIGTAQKERNAYIIGGTDVLQLLKKKPCVNNTSGYSGVSYDRSVYLWKAYIVFKRKRYYLGGYKNKSNAIQARKCAENHIYGDFLDWYSKTYPERYQKILKRKRNEVENR